jgi:hypothetical protein
MSYTIKRIELFVRETAPGRIAFKIGSAAKAERRTNPLGHVRLILADDKGREAFGCSGDRLSVRWLDKRQGRDRGMKTRQLVDLIYQAREIYLADPKVSTPFEKWLETHPKIMAIGARAGEEPLTTSLASSLIERALVDAFCRLNGASAFSMLRDDRLGFAAHLADRDLPKMPTNAWLPARPVTTFQVRHTIGPADPMRGSDVPAADRINDGLPEAVDDNIRRYGLHYFKIKLGGKVDVDIARMARIWEVLPQDPETVITFDANEAYSDLNVFAKFIERFEKELPGMFQHTTYIEQPLPRALTLDPSTAGMIRKISERKLLLIDEADGSVDAFKRAHAIGYAGTSHKNCKGFFKSLINRVRVVHYTEQGKAAFQSAEDLQNLAIAPLHQDFVTVGMLGLNNCERNGHHLNRGLAFVSPRDKESLARHHTDLYEKRGDEWYVKIRNGIVNCASLQCPGFGVVDEPDWASMEDMRSWTCRRFPA